MRFISTFSAIVSLLARLTLARQASNFNVSRSFAEAHSCNETCQKIIKLGNKYDLEETGHDFDFAFYATAKNFTGSQPGDVLKLQPVDPDTLNLRPGITVYRIQYTSLDLDGKTTVPATGFIAFPYAPPTDAPHGKYRPVAYAHGTIGLFRGCAPSNGPALYDYDTWQLLADRGYAVVGTDYAGLGNDHVDHKYCSFPAHANDVYYSMKAARAVFGHHLAPEWVGIGHSQGGGAVWKLAESELTKGDTETPYLGTVALSPASHLVDMFFDSIDAGDSEKDTRPSLVGYTPYLGLALQRADPSYDLSIYGPALQQRMAIAEKSQTCTLAFMGLTVGLSADDLISKAGLKKSAPKFKAWQRRVSPALGDRSPQPILVVQGLNDSTVLPEATTKAVKQSCKSGNELKLSMYAGAEHSPTPGGSSVEWLGWIEARFNGHKTSGRCETVVRRPFGGKFAKLPPEVDWEELKRELEL